MYDMSKGKFFILLVITISLCLQSCNGFAQTLKEVARKAVIQCSSLNEKLEAKEVVEMKVIKIVDGDTFDGLTKDFKQVRVRLAAFDAPEKGQPYGNNARQKLSELLFGKEVVVVMTGKEHYSRMIAKVYTKDSVDVVAEMLKSGMGWHFKRFDNNLLYHNMEEEARNAHVGLWHQDAHTPIAPWIWRKMSKEERDKNR